MNWFKDNWFYVFCAIAILFMMNEKYKWFDLTTKSTKTLGLEYKSKQPSAPARVSLMNKTIRVKDTEWHSQCFHTSKLLNTTLLMEVNSINGTPVDIFVSKRDDFNVVLHKRPGYLNKTLYSQREIISISDTHIFPPKQTLCFGVHHADGPVNKVASIFVGEKHAAAIKVKLEAF